MDGYTLSISRCSGGDGVEESFKAKIKRREAALDAFAVAEAYCKESWMVSRCEREGFDGFIDQKTCDNADRQDRSHLTHQVCSKYCHNEDKYADNQRTQQIRKSGQGT